MVSTNPSCAGMKASNLTTVAVTTVDKVAAAAFFLYSAKSGEHTLPPSPCPCLSSRTATHCWSRCACSGRRLRS
eukprot:3010108-Prymnesium_polylepis.1